MEILTAIFEQMETTEEWRRICGRIDTKITKALDKMSEKCSISDCEEIRDGVFAVIHDAEKQAFAKGFEYALKLWMECSMEDH